MWRAFRASLLMASVLALGGCGDGGTGPSENAVAGTWNFTAIDLTVAGAPGRCSISGQLYLTQTGTTVSGTYTMTQLTCTGPQGTQTDPGPYTGTIVAGTVSGNQIHFHFDTTDADQHGTISGQSMAGTCTWVAYMNGMSYTMSGTWTATRA
jgi:hypothetical protein